MALQFYVLLTADVAVLLTRSYVGPTTLTALSLIFIFHISSRNAYKELVGLSSSLFVYLTDIFQLKMQRNGDELVSDVP